PVLKPTAHWFIKLDSLQARVKEFIEAHSAGGKHPWRESVLREARGWLTTGLQPRSITRDTTWGVKIPLADPEVEGKSIFVWFDAPIGYVTFTQQLVAKEGKPEAWKDYWQNPECEIYNFIGKDNKWFHAIFWPAMLMAANESVPAGEKPYQLATEVVANEFLTFGGEKGSKSKGNALEIDWFAQKYSSEPLRYYLTAIAPETNDSNFTWDDFRQRYNGELADVLGNYIHRVLTFAVNKLGGKVPDGAAGADKAFTDETVTAVSNSSALLDGCQFRNALATIISCARAGNVYFDGNAPWKLLKSDTAACDRVMYACLCRAAAIGLMLRPILPKSATAILKNFGVANPMAPGLRLEDICKPGTVLQKPEVLFKKLEPTDLPEVKA
ncbi:MAG TPA: class I tRNA ligase family protein, partial [Planctomycetota bacterium]|nr:class I tRNA ligase family protein [Planctomycetota bacterium]